MSKKLLVALRVALGWLFFYAGITKVLDPSWSAAGYLAGAKSFAGFFHWLASPGVLGVTDALNAWGLTLIGVALMLGIAVRLASVLGAAMMMLYYLSILEFPHPNAYSFLVDEHIIYALALLFLAAVRAGGTSGLYRWASGLPVFKRHRRLRALLD